MSTLNYKYSIGDRVMTTVDHTPREYVGEIVDKADGFNNGRLAYVIRVEGTSDNEILVFEDKIQCVLPSLDGCPCCSETAHYPVAGFGDRLVICKGCGGEYTPRDETLTEAESYSRVIDKFTTDPSADDRQKYFDHSYIDGENGIPKRRHGWYDPTTSRLTQIG